MQLRKRNVFILTALFALAVLALPTPSFAQGLKTYAVLPFKIVGPDKYKHLGKGAQSMLASRLNWVGHFEDAGMGVADRAGNVAPASSTEALSVLGQLGVDYLVWGDITVDGDQALMNVKLQGVDGISWTKSKDGTVAEIIPGLEELSKNIRGEIFERPGDMEKAGDAPKMEERPAGPQNPDFVQAQAEQEVSYKESSINPQFRYEGGANSTGRWRSRNFKFASDSMAIGDADGDGKNEIFILGAGKIHAFQMHQDKLKLVSEHKIHSRVKFLRVRLIDLDKDGTQEIVVSSYWGGAELNPNKVPEGAPKSWILSYRNGKFQTILDDERIYLNVIETPPTYSATLVGQKAGRRELFEVRDLKNVFFSKGEIVPGQGVHAPPGANLFNLAYLPDSSTGGYKIVVVTDFNRIKTYTSDLELESETEETYNSSSHEIEFTSSSFGMKNPKNTVRSYYYPPMGMTVVSFTKGKYQLLVNKDISVAASVFGRFKTFSQGELHALFWDGVGMNLAWKTRRIKGTVVDYAVADMNNDGKAQLCVLVNTYPGPVGLKHRKTLVLAYDLNLGN